MKIRFTIQLMMKSGSAPSEMSVSHDVSCHIRQTSYGVTVAVKKRAERVKKSHRCIICERGLSRPLPIWDTRDCRRPTSFLISSASRSALRETPSLMSPAMSSS